MSCCSSNLRAARDLQVQVAVVSRSRELRCWLGDHVRCIRRWECASRELVMTHRCHAAICRVGFRLVEVRTSHWARTGPHCRLTLPITRRRREIVHLKTPDFAARVHWVVIRRVANRCGQSPRSFRDARASFLINLSGIGFFIEKVTPVLVAFRPAAAISSARAIMAPLLT